MDDIRATVEQIRGDAKSYTEFLRDSLEDRKSDNYRKTITIWALIAALALGAVAGMVLMYVTNRSHISAMLTLNREHYAHVSDITAAHNKAWTDFFDQFDVIEFGDEIEIDSRIEIEGENNTNHGDIDIIVK
jgi:hypothetical protein